MVGRDSNVSRSICNHSQYGIEHSDNRAEPTPLTAAAVLQSVKVAKDLVGSVDKMNDQYYGSTVVWTVSWPP